MSLKNSLTRKMPSLTVLNFRVAELYSMQDILVKFVARCGRSV